MFFACLPVLLAQALPPGSLELEARRKALQHQALLTELTAQLEAESDEATRVVLGADLAIVRLEAQLLTRAVPLEELAAARPKPLLRKLATLEKTPMEALTLARFAFLQGANDTAEEALGVARDGDADLAAETNRLLAEARGEDVPKGGYVRYRGLWLPLAERDSARALDEALEALATIESRESLVPFAPSSDESNHERFAGLGPGAGEARLRESCVLVRKSLEGEYEEVRRWIQSYVRQPQLREELLAAYAELAPERRQALQLIARYDKPQQGEVDAYRQRLESMYAEFEKLVERDFARFERTTPQEAWELDQRLQEETGEDYWAQFIRGERGEERLPMPWIDMPQDQLEHELKRAYYSFYFRPAYILRTLRQTRSREELERYIKVGLRMVGNHFFSDMDGAG